MVVSSAAKCARGNEGVEAYVRSLRLKAPDAIKRRLKRALEEGELSASIDASRVTAFYATVAQGLGVRAGDGVSRAELVAVVDGAMGRVGQPREGVAEAAKRPLSRRIADWNGAVSRGRPSATARPGGSPASARRVSPDRHSRGRLATCAGPPIVYRILKNSFTRVRPRILLPGQHPWGGRPSPRRRASTYSPRRPARS